MNAVAVLRGAQNALMEKGWCKYALQEDDGRVCALGALNVAITGDAESIVQSIQSESYGDAYKFLLTEAERRGVRDVADYNNTIAVSFNDIMDFFDEAILLAKEDEARGAGRPVGSTGQEPSDLGSPTPAPSSSVSEVG